MSSRLWRTSAVVAAFVCVAVPVAAGRPDRPDGRPDTRAAAVRHAPGVARPVGPTSVAAATFGARTTAILGAAWTADNLPIKQAKLRLRNVVSGKIEAATTANDAGKFTFDNVPGGSYVVELVNQGGHIEVVGHVFTIAPGETVATFVRTRTKVPWFTGFFNNSMSAVAATAAGQGVTAIAPVVREASRQ